MKLWQRCPVCNGTGLVNRGFFLSALGDGVSNATNPETCRCCKGTGTIVTPDELPEKEVIKEYENSHHTG